MKSTDSVIVSWDFSHGKDVGVKYWPVFILCERATSSTSGWNSANGLRHCRIRRLLLEKKLNFMLMERR